MRSITSTARPRTGSRREGADRQSEGRHPRAAARCTVVHVRRRARSTLEDFGVSGFIHTDDGAIVIGEPHVAATWFPANDHPRDKASFTFQITVPAGLEAVANGVLLGTQTSGGWTTWTWDAVEPMATYLADDGHRPVRHRRAYQQAASSTGTRIDSEPLRRSAAGDHPRAPAPRSSTRRSPTIDVQAAHPDDRGAGRRRDAVVPGQPGHGARLGLPLRRGPHGRPGRLDDAARRERPHEPGHRRSRASGLQDCTRS